MASPGPNVPRATYRLQFHAGFGFADAKAIVPYLAALGISHLYASPITMARPGSLHGYDVIDFNRLNPELGDDAAFDALVAELHAHGMGLLVDFVPNHMGVGSDNPWWLDVLEWGPGRRREPAPQKEPPPDPAGDAKGGPARAGGGTASKAPRGPPARSGPL